MSSPLRSTALRAAGSRVDVPIAVFAWLVAWIVGQLVALTIVAVAGYSDVNDAPIWLLFVSQLVVWAMFLLAMVLASRQAGSGRFIPDYQVRLKPLDVLGVPMGVLTQLVVVPLVYLPLERIWEGTFTDEKLSENAKELVDRASGSSMVLLVLMVCVGAPIIEELVYRGLLMGSFAARFNHTPALVASAVLFSLIHLRPVEYPGLFVVGMVCGAAMLLTGRIGSAVACHVGFNVAGLLLALD